MIKVYFKPDCSKCIATECLLEEKEIKFQKIEYLNSPPSKSDLISIVQKLGIPAYGLIRKTESTFIKKYGNRTLSEDESIAAMLEDPILIERPIIVDDDRAIIGRPPEKLLEFLKNL